MTVAARRLFFYNNLRPPQRGKAAAQTQKGGGQIFVTFSETFYVQLLNLLIASLH